MTLLPDPIPLYHILLLALALDLWIAGFLHTGKYVRPRWKQPGKLLFYLAVSHLLLTWTGFWALIFIIGHPLLGLLFHIKVCRKHGINWKTCQPREKYMELHEKWGRGDFS